MNKKTKPSLVDEKVFNYYNKLKNPDPIKIIHLPPKAPSELERLFSKISHSIISFFYDYFILISLLLAIGFYLFYRYKWYQEHKNNKIKNNEIKEIKKIIIDPRDSSDISNIYEIPKIAQIPKISEIPEIVQMPKQINKSNISKASLITNTRGNSHMLRNINNLNNINNTNQEINKINKERNVSFEPHKQKLFDAYNRNLINPKNNEKLLASNENSRYFMLD
jgi:hypothetical protein